MTRLLYVSPADLQANTVVWGAIKNMAPQVILDKLANASATAESYLSSRYTLPFLSYGPDFKRAVFDIAVYDLLSERGMSLDGADANYRARFKDAVDWLKRVNQGQATPLGLEDQSPQRSGTAPRVASTRPRGW